MHFTTKNSPGIYLDISYANILNLMIQNILGYVYTSILYTVLEKSC